jgi:hypothetical protein
MLADGDVRLPIPDEQPRPTLALLVLAKELAREYSDTLEQPLPEPLAKVVREIKKRARDGRTLRALGQKPVAIGGVSVGAPALRRVDTPTTSQACPFGEPRTEATSA